MFFEVETFRYHASFAAKSSRGKNSKGRKITSMVPFPGPSSGGQRLLVTSNDSRIRLYQISEKRIESKFWGHENASSQIRSGFSDDGRFIISGSEDRHVFSQSLFSSFSCHVLMGLCSLGLWTPPEGRGRMVPLEEKGRSLLRILPQYVSPPLLLTPTNVRSNSVKQHNNLRPLRPLYNPHTSIHFLRPNLLIRPSTDSTTLYDPLRRFSEPL